MKIHVRIRFLSCLSGSELIKFYRALPLVFLSCLSGSELRKGQKSRLTPGELDVTSADEGGSIPVIFGTCDVAPNVTAFLAGTPKAIKK